MSLRFVQFSLDELSRDAEGIARCLTQACQRDGRLYQVTGVCPTGRTVVFPLEQAADGRRRRYEIRPFSGLLDEDVMADIRSRWQGGFSTRGLVQLGEIWLGLFEIVEAPPAPAPVS